MNMTDIIVKKRNGGKLSDEEICYFIEEYTNGRIPDYQASALLMAIFFIKMDRDETYSLTRAMKNSGDIIDLSEIHGIKVDKHSTGGVGDKTTLIAAPIAAACGVSVAKMSGRGLGFTGGTIDKLESIPGMRTALGRKEFADLVNKCGIAVTGQTEQTAKADKLLYALRDVTGTVENASLIASSVMCKKLASGSDAILLDVKCGSGAFMHTYEEACELAEIMVDIGRGDGKRTAAAVTSMDQPLGNAVGNTLEVIEAIETLKGKGPDDITELSLRLAGLMIYLADKAPDPDSGADMAQQVLTSGAALAKFRAFTAGQGGDTRVIDDYSRLPQPQHTLEIHAEQTGFVRTLDAEMIGSASQHTGAGREKKGDDIDLTAGIILNKKNGDAVRTGERLATLYGCDENRLKQAEGECRRAFEIGRERPEKDSLIKTVIGI